MHTYVGYWGKGNARCPRPHTLSPGDEQGPPQDHLFWGSPCPPQKMHTYDRTKPQTKRQQPHESDHHPGDASVHQPIVGERADDGEASVNCRSSQGPETENILFLRRLRI